MSDFDTTEQNHDINNISARFLKHKILKMNGVSLPTVAWVKKRLMLEDDTQKTISAIQFFSGKVSWINNDILIYIS